MNESDWITYKNVTKAELEEKAFKFGPNVNIHSSVNMQGPIHFSGGNQVHRGGRIGRYTFINWDVILFPNVNVGSFCSFGRNIQVGVAQHPTEWLSTSSFQYTDVVFPNDKSYMDIKRTMHEEHPATKVGSDVWIGANVVVLSGVTIGDGAIVGAGAVVTKNVPDYSIVGGVPAKVIKYRFNEVLRNKLLKSKWWELPIKDLRSLNFSDPLNALSQLEVMEVESKC